MTVNIAADVEAGLKLFQQFDPVLAGVPWIGPLLPYINGVLPAAIQAVDIVAKDAVETTSAAMSTVVNHLTPGQPNAPALS